MPSANEHLKDNNSLRILVYGPAKSKKTWWATRAAEAGFRVLLFDFEDGSGILKQLAPNVRERIFILPLADNAKDTYAVTSAVVALKGYDFYVNEKTRRVTQTPQIGSYHINMCDFGRDTVVVFDSYTAIVNSVTKQFALEHKIDLSNASKTDWDGYGFAGRLLNWMLGQMEHFPCPFILIGHETQNVVKKKVLGGLEAQKKAPIEMVRRQVYSSSNPHGMGIGKNFTDILYMYADGRSFKIDTRGNKQEDGGCRNLEPGLYSWDELTFEAIAKAANIPMPTQVEKWDFTVVQNQLAKIQPIMQGGKTEAGVIENKVQPAKAPRGNGLTFKLGIK